jgi:hypothetical protein
VRACRETGYDAVALGPREWLTPLRELRRWLEAGDTAWLSTTAAPDDGPALPLAREVKREWGERKLAIVSDLRAEQAALPKRKLDELAFTPAAALRERVAALKKAGFAVVAVAHADAKATADACDADLVVRAVPKADATLGEAGGRPVARVGGAARVGVLALKLAGARIADVEYRLETVDGRWPEDERLRATAADYAKAAAPKTPATRDAGIAYVAASECKDCHQAEYGAWKKRPHARAFDTVAQSGRATDRSCLACHATGAGTETGFRSREETPGLDSVACQVCHRFSLDEHGGGGFSGYPTEAKLCRECHTDATDPGFDFEKRRAKVGCVAK